MKIQRSCTYLHKMFAVRELKKALDYCSSRTHVCHLSFPGEVLCDDTIGLTENAMELMEQFFELKLRSKNILHKLKKIISKSMQKPVEFKSDSEVDNGVA